MEALLPVGIQLLQEFLHPDCQSVDVARVGAALEAGLEAGLGAGI